MVHWLDLPPARKMSDLASSSQTKLRKLSWRGESFS